ncbi:PAS domain S-box protein, partial [Alicyclobacillus macrosporangiidus]|uniref:PAS domain-containing protein n=1 Tax=Alicyclobacillus macrosporangiidus TaxID=392015 RepID=UPI0026F2C50B
MSQQLAHAVRIAGLGHLDWDIVNDHITLSDQMKRILGFTHGETSLTYATFLKFVHPDDVQRVKRAVMNSLQNKYLPVECEWRIIRNDGSIRHLHGQGEVLFDTTGDPVRIIGTVRDITEWKEQERLLYENQSLMKYNPDGVCAFDLTGKYTDVNDAFQKLVGYTKDELIGRRYRDLILFPEDVPLAKRLFRAVLNGESQQNVEFAVRRKDGKRVEVSVTTAPILVRGELVGLYVILKDVTEHKLSRQKLMQSEERYRQLIENSLDAIGIHDGDKWLFMNAPGLKMFGAESETDMIGKPVSDFVKP